MVQPETFKYLINAGITQEELNEWINIETGDEYNIFQIRHGRSGKLRKIEEPVPVLKKIQRALIPLYEKFNLSSACKAIKGHGILDNASPHKDAKHILRVDIKSCYPSIHYWHIKEAFKKSTINEYSLMIDTLKFCLISNVHNESVLPTGAPTSPILCNIALTPLDNQLKQLADDMGYEYTRYIDDLHFSTTKEERDWNLISKVEDILLTLDLRSNKKKTKWMTHGYNDNLTVTGVRLGGEDTVPRHFKRMVRAKLFNLAKVGAPIDKEAMGCLAHIKQIDPVKYQKFISYYNEKLTNAADHKHKHHKNWKCKKVNDTTDYKGERSRSK